MRNWEMFKLPRVVVFYVKDLDKTKLYCFCFILREIFSAKSFTISGFEACFQEPEKKAKTAKTWAVYSLHTFYQLFV